MPSGERGGYEYNPFNSEGKVQMLCFCESKMFWVDPGNVKRGIGISCGKRKCEQLKEDYERKYSVP